MISRHLIALTFVAIGAWMLPGCGQGEGGACQLDTDCAAGLSCACQLGGRGSSRGICRPIGTTCGTVSVDGGADAAIGTDADGDAASVDAGTDADTGTTDLDAGDDAGTDAGDDAGTDAGTDAASDDAALDATNDAG